MRQKLQEINNMLEEKSRANAEKYEKANQERNALPVKIAELEKKKAKASSMDESREITRQLEDANFNLNYLKGVKYTPVVITPDDCKELESEVNQAFDVIKQEYADGIAQKFAELQELMDAYITEYIDCNETINTIRHCAFERLFTNNELNASSIADFTNDPFDWIADFTSFYLSHYNEVMAAQKLCNGERSSKTVFYDSKRAAKYAQAWAELNKV